ncbi:putative baseplate assembly protein [Kribbella sp. NBC_01505]|uniref:putative baseplate assembly protein n=1 Tax=Kribbella sp. NBC_01505 TaxID=2903580 RepID=UPI003869E32A
MSLQAPHLDDREFQDLVDEAKRFVQRRCPEWTDHNVSDPGVTLIEAFATMVDQLIYRLNRVPERHYLRFLDLAGVRLYAPTAARTRVTFWLSTPQPDPVAIRAGTEVATVRDDATRPVVFSTVEDLEVPPAKLAAAATQAAGAAPADHTMEVLDERPFDCFAPEPRSGDAFYVGLDHPVPSCAVLLRFDCQVRGIGVDPTDPPIRWDAWTGDSWTPCVLEHDQTGGLNRSGDVVVHVPPGHQSSVIAQQAASWLRCSIVESEPQQTFYSRSPRIEGLYAATVGGSTTAVHAELVESEELGQSDGSPGQVLDLNRPPVVRVDADEVLEVADSSGWQTWTQVESFTESTAADRHFVLDRHRGQVVLGPAVRLADGNLQQYGATPPKGATLRISRYHTGGGVVGNVAARTLQVLKSSIPHVATVGNRDPAVGGVNGESVADAMVRGPLEFRTRDRAVTAADYELLARKAAPELARVHCVPAGVGQGEAGLARLLVIPKLTHDPDAQLEFVQLRPSDEVLARVADFLEERRTLGTRLLVEPPFFRGITVVARLTAQRNVSARRLRAAAAEAVYRFLDPLYGGSRETGWPLGTDVRVADLHACFGRLEGVESVDDVRLFVADPVLGTRQAEPVQRLELGPTELPFSYEHQVQVQ